MPQLQLFDEAHNPEPKFEKTIEQPMREQQKAELEQTLLKSCINFDQWQLWNFLQLAKYEQRDEHSRGNRREALQFSSATPQKQGSSATTHCATSKFQEIVCKYRLPSSEETIAFVFFVPERQNFELLQEQKKLLAGQEIAQSLLC